MGKYTRNVDWLTVILLILLGSFGLFLLLSTENNLFIQQLFFLLIGLGLLYFVSRIDREILSWFAPIGYILSLILLALSYIGPNIRGATRWIIIGGVQLQPSELVKPVLILGFSWLMAKFPPRKLANLPILFIDFAIPFLLVFKQPDLGTSLVYASFFIAMLIAGGLEVRLIILFIVISGLITPVIWHNLAIYQQSRILSFINPSLDPKGAGYNALQATIAIGSGQLFGRGLGFGTQSHLQFLPEYHTDFIFASLIEELGFFGGFILLSTYVVLLWRILIQAWKMRGQLFAFIFSFGIFAMLLSQVFINTGMNMGILPITGITLPFVSYGGSSLISLSVTFGLFWSIISDKNRQDGIAIN